MTKTTFGASLLAIAVATIVTFGAAVPANASTTNGANGSHQDCGVFIDTGVTICVPSGGDLHAAVMQQTGRTIATVYTAGTAAAAAATPQSARTSYLLGRLYDDQGYGGSYEEFYGLGSGCTASASFGWADIGSSWYGRVSSFRSYSSCTTKVFDGTGYSGASYGFFAASFYVGNAMNDRSKSVQFHG